MLFFDGYPALISERKCRYDKFRGAYYVVNTDFDGRIGLPSSENAIFMSMHQTMF
ncbi:hypothetical protein EHF_0499 [Ehrlichia japonica]|uniref:Uncharacterized protein n=1 Tax=Ehrlichia japonica TaxID=391036 RepID=X5H1D2_9RICK|nr:hypothetical protein EHF_0499 [Ehrlichia japonica]